jgi:hypothetical protein
MRNDYGFAMVIALIVALVLSLLCLSVTLSSMSELKISNEFENHEKAILIAEAGFNRERQGLRGDQLDTLLAQPGTMLVFKADQTAPEWAMRNPISPIDARNIDFASPSTTGCVASTVTGLLTPTTGQVVPGGRYFARLTDNPEPDNDPAKDSDGTVYLRVIGIASGLPGESNSYGSERKNAVAIIEGVLHRDSSFNMSSPLSLLGPHVNAQFGGEPLLIDGYDHETMTAADLMKPGNAVEPNQEKAHEGLSALPAINCLDPVNASAAVEELKEALKAKQNDNVIGAGGEPSIADGSNDLLTDPNPETRNVLDAAYMYSIAQKVAGIADLRYEGNQSLGGQGQDVLALGTSASPKITYVHGDLNVSGNIVGSGLLIVTGDLKGTGSLIYEGLILVLGTGVVTFGGANNGILGGLLAANLTGTPPQFGNTSISITGNSNFYFKGDAIRMAVSLLSMRTLSWREITPEIEPVASASPTL